MSDTPKILAFAGSLRKDSLNKKVLNIAADAARAAGAEVTIVDLLELGIPLYNADIQDNEGFPEGAIKFQEMLYASDGFLICSPEYNGSIPGGLKNAIDWASRARGEIKTNEAFKNRAAAIITATPGAFGGLRCLIHLRAVLSMMQADVLTTEMAIPFIAQKFDGDKMIDETYRGRVEGLAALLVEKAQKAKAETEIK